MKMTSIDSDSMDYIVDKGTFDALCSENSLDTQEKCKAYMNEIVRVMNPKGGLFLCVSLLEDFVLQ